MAAETIMRGMTRETLPNGACFVRLHYSADPEKNAEWAADGQRRESDPRNWEVQMEMRDVVLDGMPVFSTYVDKLHCPERTWQSIQPLYQTLGQDGKIFYPAQYFMGWDAGQTLSPAAVLLELIPELRVNVLLEVVSTTAESMDEFAPRVKQVLESTYPEIISKIRHYGDATIVTRSGSDKTTAQEVAQRYGFQIQASTNDWTMRQAAVSNLLSLGLPNDPCYQVCGKGCPVLRRGFQGMYKFELSRRGETTGPGAIVMVPLKNSYSHIQDANQYASIPIYEILMPGGRRFDVF